LALFSFSVSTHTLCKDGLKHTVLLRTRDKFANPDDLLESLISADLNDDFLGITKLVGRETVLPVYKKSNVAVPCNGRRSRNLVDGAPRKSERSRLVDGTGQETC